MSDEELEGPVTNRSCRDVPCCIIFVVFIVGMVSHGTTHTYTGLLSLDFYKNECTNLGNFNVGLLDLNLPQATPTKPQNSATGKHTPILVYSA